MRAIEPPSSGQMLLIYEIPSRLPHGRLYLHDRLPIEGCAEPLGVNLKIPQQTFGDAAATNHPKYRSQKGNRDRKKSRIQPHFHSKQVQNLCKTNCLAISNGISTRRRRRWVFGN